MSAYCSRMTSWPRALWMFPQSPPLVTQSIEQPPEGATYKHLDGWRWRLGIDVWAELRSERETQLQFQGAGAQPWIPGRRNGVARGMYNRFVADDRFPGAQISAEAQWRLKNLISGWGVLVLSSGFWAQSGESFWAGR